MTQGGPTIPVTVSTDAPVGEPALRVVVVNSGVTGGPAVPVYLVTAAQVAAGYPVQGNAPVPMAAVIGRPALGQRPIPVYVTSGVLEYGAVLKMLATRAGNLLALWPLDDASGTTTMRDASGNGRNGTHPSTTAPTRGQAAIIPGAGLSASYNGTQGSNAYSASLAGAFNGNAGTLLIPCRVTDSSVWTDGANHYGAFLQADASNFAYIRKSTTNNQLAFVRTGGGTGKSVLISNVSRTDTMYLALTWDTAAGAASGQVKAYINGGQVGATQTGIGTFAGSLGSSSALIGATTTGGSNGWKGWLQAPAIWSAALTEVELATVSNAAGFVVYDGDSRMVGVSTPIPQLIQEANLGLRYGLKNLGVSGQTVAQMAADVATEYPPLWYTYGKNVAVVWGGVNDAAAGASAATIWARLQTWCEAVRDLGYKVVLCTEIDGQSAGLNAVSYSGTIRPALNTLISGGWVGVADALADIGGNANLQDATNTTYFNADKLHLIAAGQTVAAGIIGAAVASV